MNQSTLNKIPNVKWSYIQKDNEYPALREGTLDNGKTITCTIVLQEFTPYSGGKTWVCTIPPNGFGYNKNLNDAILEAYNSDRQTILSK